GGRGETMCATSCQRRDRFEPSLRCREGHPEDGTHRSANRLAIERISACAIEQNAVHTEGRGHPEQTADVVRIANPLERQKARCGLKSACWVDCWWTFADREAAAVK